VSHISRSQRSERSLRYPIPYQAFSNPLIIFANFLADSLKISIIISLLSLHRDRVSRKTFPAERKPILCSFPLGQSAKVGKTIPPLFWPGVYHPHPPMCSSFSSSPENRSLSSQSLSTAFASGHPLSSYLHSCLAYVMVSSRLPLHMR